ncbi:MAG: histidinol-phosphatase [Oscillospiraceae bacterium]|nr:histidinol-phosphatase [Oscillospiraceae bacterium]
MYPLSNLHTHTNFCDGKYSPEEMVQAAIRENFVSLGFSGHSFTPCDMSYCMLPEKIPLYKAEIRRLQEKYKDQIEIYLGTERDYYTEHGEFTDDYDYMLGSVHYILKGRRCYAIDHAESEQIDAVREVYGGDWWGLIRDYYELMARLPERFTPDVIGHFDVITKFNEGGRLFDEEDPVYKNVAMEAMEAILPHCRLFEMNTGAIARKKRTTPYIAPFLLRFLKEHGGEICINSDCHDWHYLTCAFDMAVEQARAAGFTHAKILKGGRFEDVKL